MNLDFFMDTVFIGLSPDMNWKMNEKCNVTTKTCEKGETVIQCRVAKSHLRLRWLDL